MKKRKEKRGENYGEEKLRKGARRWKERIMADGKKQKEEERRRAVRRSTNGGKKSEREREREGWREGNARGIGEKGKTPPKI